MPKCLDDNDVHEHEEHCQLPGRVDSILITSILFHVMLRTTMAAMVRIIEKQQLR